MRRLTSAILVAAVAVCGGALQAQTITVSANPALMRVNAAVPGAQPTEVSNAVTTYTVTTKANGQIKRITGRLTAALPAGTSVSVIMAAPTGATSMGEVTLTTVAQDLVINIPKGTNTTRSITYTFTATVTGGVVANATKTIRFQLVT